MLNVQRVIIVLGVIAALGTAFIWPPVYVQVKGTRFSMDQCIDDGGEMARRDCLELANPDGSLLLAYLMVIAGSTAALVYATRPRT